MVGVLRCGPVGIGVCAAAAFTLLEAVACDPSGITAHPRSTSGGAPGSGGSPGAGGSFGTGGSDVFVGNGGGPIGAGGEPCLSITWDSFPGDAGTWDAGPLPRDPTDASALDAGETDASAVQDGSALNDARCRATLPPFSGRTRLDPTRVSLTVSRNESFQGFIRQVPSCDVDGGASGYTFDDLISPTALVLCPTACARFRTEPLRITAHFDCIEYGNPW